MDKNILEVKNLKKYFPVRKMGKKQYVKAVDDLNFSIREGEIFGVLGESGCGKSTLGRVINRLDFEQSGDITFLNNVISGKSYKSDKNFRKKMQMIFQNPYDSFDPKMLIYKSIELPMKINDVNSDAGSRINEIVETMNKAKLTPAESLLTRYPHELSGGQLQRISIIRSMLLKPKFIIADECVSMLDVSVRAGVLNLLLTFQEELNSAMLFITHDISVATYICNRIMVLYAGKIMEIAESKDILDNPLHPYTRALVSYSPIISKEEKKRFRITGEVVTPIDPPPGCRFASRCPMAKDICKKEEPILKEIGKNRKAACHFV
ncbi:MAG: hypothetical protein PWQ77_1152 [Kosmotogales bacterium]|nr:hypothetical protein [Kosmotogales bacterium]